MFTLFVPVGLLLLDLVERPFRLSLFQLVLQFELVNRFSEIFSRQFIQLRFPVANSVVVEQVLQLVCIDFPLGFLLFEGLLSGFYLLSLDF